MKKPRVTAMLVALPAALTLDRFSALGAEAYARPDLLIEPAALLEAKDLVVLDARPRKDFEAGRVPGARWVDAAAWAKAFGDGADARGWSRRIGTLGIAPATRVIVYDGALLKDAARIWWILRYWGAEDVRLLNGAWKGWKSSGGGVETQPPAEVKPVEFAARPHRERLAT